jgi:hypothetical protein
MLIKIKEINKNVIKTVYKRETCIPFVVRKVKRNHYLSGLELAPPVTTIV